ncbi:PhoH family protein [Planctomycetota bacterium]
MDVRIELQCPEELLDLFGSHDQYLKLVRESFQGVTIVARNGVVKLTGRDNEVEAAERVLRRLLRLTRQNQPLAHADVEDALRDEELALPLTREDLSRRRSADVAPGSAVQLRTIRVHPRTDGQRRYVELMDGNEIVFGLGPAGTGKTFLAVLKGVERLRAGDVERIILSRPAVEAGEKLGFLPGDFHAKVNPYLRPLYDALHELLDRETVGKLIEREIVEIVPLAYMRGRTLNRAFIILDEAQNTTSTQMKMFLTRMGEESRIVVTGDPTQQDLPPGKLSGLTHIQRILPATKGIAFHRMGKKDIVRHPLVWKIVKAYEIAEGT